jgi:acetyl esterase/lipase
MSPSPESPRPEAPRRKLRLLCLHGYHGSAEVMRSQMRALFEGLESLVELVCVDAPSLAQGDFGWWHAVQDERAPAREDPDLGSAARHYKGWARSRDALIERFQRQGPFDGVFGFSQGAALTGLLVGLRASDGRPTREHPLAFRFAVLVSGFPSNDPSHGALYASRASYALPSLHLVGRADGIVPPRETRALAARFANPLVVEHDGGHVIASTPAVRAQVRDFLEARLREVSAEALAAPREPLTSPLWPGRESPVMTLHFPQAPRSHPAPAMLVFQGGGYATHSGSGGGSAEWLATQGFVGVRVEYRVRNAPDAFLAGYADAARAMRRVRHHAARWGVDPARVGVLGYSAGGHLASLLSTQPELFKDPADDLAGHVSARPDLVVLAYPVISFVEGYAPGAYASSAENFFSRRELPEELRRRFSNELHVRPGHPPVFIWTMRDDHLVPHTHSVRFAEACEAAGVPVTFKLFAHGLHGMGLALEDRSESGAWTKFLLEWLDAHCDRRAAPP